MSTLGLTGHQFSAYDIDHGNGGAQGSTVIYVNNNKDNPVTITVMNRNDGNAVSVARVVSDSSGNKRVVGVIFPLSSTQQTIMPHGEVFVSMSSTKRLYPDRDVQIGRDRGVIAVGSVDHSGKPSVDVRLGGIVVTSRMYELTAGHDRAMIGMRVQTKDGVELVGPPQPEPYLWDLPDTPAGIKLQDGNYVVTGLTPVANRDNLTWQPWSVSVPADLLVTEPA